MGPDRGLITTVAATVSDPTRLRARLDELAPVSDQAEARTIAAALMGRLGKAVSVVPSALEPAGHPVADDWPADLLALDVPGLVWEWLLAPADRRRGGSHYTPYRVARRLVELARGGRRSGEIRSVLDPAAGAGVFLLAAAEVLADDCDRGDLVARLWGFDVDRTALDLADAMLEIWCGGRTRPQLHRLDFLVDEPPRPDGGFDLIVGNPPFLGQLAADTVRSQERRRRVEERFGVAASGYVDDAAVFLRAGSDVLAPGGAMTLIQPQSVLGAAHARGVREALAADLDLAALWIEDSPTFEAGVDVCAPVFVRRTAGGSVEVVAGSGPAVTLESPSTDSWAPLLARSRGLPQVRLAGPSRVSDVAAVTAGFRQHFYGIADAVREANDSAAPVSEAEPRLVTAGAIDPFRLGWGTAPVRFAGRRWHRPIVDLSRAEPDVVDWYRDRLRPKVLVASQTRIVEAVIDEVGLLVPSVPVISVEPEELDVAMLAAVVAAPPVSAHMAAIAAGTGLSADSIRVRAATLAELPLPADEAAWREGAENARAAQAAAAADDTETHRACLRSFGEAMTSAFAQPSSVTDWWWERLQFRA